MANQNEFNEGEQQPESRAGESVATKVTEETAKRDELLDQQRSEILDKRSRASVSDAASMTSQLLGRPAGLEDLGIAGTEGKQLAAQVEVTNLKGVFNGTDQPVETGGFFVPPADRGVTFPGLEPNRDYEVDRVEVTHNDDGGTTTETRYDLGDGAFSDTDVTSRVTTDADGQWREIEMCYRPPLSEITIPALHGEQGTGLHLKNVENMKITKNPDGSITVDIEPSQTFPKPFNRVVMHPDGRIEYSQEQPRQR